MPAGVEGPGFLIFRNLRLIMRYKPAEAYALATGHLADRLRAGGPFAQSWPRYERMLTREERLELQRLLARDTARDPGLSGPQRQGSGRLRIGHYSKF